MPNATDRRLWRDISVFDGLQTLSDRMAVITEGARIITCRP